MLMSGGVIVHQFLLRWKMVMVMMMVVMMGKSRLLVRSEDGKRFSIGSDGAA